MLSLRDLTYTEIATRIILSVLFGGILGMERGMKNRGAGLRTYRGRLCERTVSLILTSHRRPGISACHG